MSKVSRQTNEISGKHESLFHNHHAISQCRNKRLLVIELLEYIKHIIKDSNISLVLILIKNSSLIKKVKP